MEWASGQRGRRFWKILAGGKGPKNGRAWSGMQTCETEPSKVRSGVREELRAGEGAAPAEDPESQSLWWEQASGRSRPLREGRQTL